MICDARNMSSDQRFQVFFDGDCPLCKREIRWLQKRDRHQQIEFIDIAVNDFDQAGHGKSYGELMAEIHGRRPDGQWITGVDVFRQLYEAAGFGPAVRLSRLPLMRQGLDVGYRIFARYRTRLTGRCKDARCQVRLASSTTSSDNTASSPDRLAKESVS